MLLNIDVIHLKTFSFRVINSEFTDQFPQHTTYDCHRQIYWMRRAPRQSCLLCAFPLFALSINLYYQFINFYVRIHAFSSRFHSIFFFQFICDTILQKLYVLVTNRCETKRIFVSRSIHFKINCRSNSTIFGFFP